MPQIRTFWDTLKNASAKSAPKYIPCTTSGFMHKRIDGFQGNEKISLEKEFLLLGIVDKELPKRCGGHKGWVSFGPSLTGQNISLIQQNKLIKKNTLQSP
jgi:hypothetical protein